MDKQRLSHELDIRILEAIDLVDSGDAEEYVIISMGGSLGTWKVLATTERLERFRKQVSGVFNQWRKPVYRPHRARGARQALNAMITEKDFGNARVFATMTNLTDRRI